MIPARIFCTRTNPHSCESFRFFILRALFSCCGHNAQHLFGYNFIFFILFLPFAAASIHRNPLYLEMSLRKSVAFNTDIVDVTRWICIRFSEFTYRCPESINVVVDFAIGLKQKKQELWASNGSVCHMMRVCCFGWNLYYSFSCFVLHSTMSNACAKWKAKTRFVSTAFSLFFLGTVGSDYTALIILLSAYIMISSAFLRLYLSLPRVTQTTNKNHYVAWIADCDRSWRQICQRKK